MLFISYGLSGFYHIFPHCLINDSIFGEKWTWNVFIFPAPFFWTNSHTVKNLTVITNLHGELRKIPDFNETWIFSTAFPRIHNCQISLNAFSGSRVVPYGPTDMTKPTEIFRHSSNASKDAGIIFSWQKPRSNLDISKNYGTVACNVECVKEWCRA